MSKTNIQISRWTKDAIASLGAKADTYDDIVLGLFHQRNILMIHHYCGDKVFDEEDFGGWVYNCFKDCNIPYPEFITSYEDDGTPKLIPFTDVHILNCEEMATDGDLVGHAVSHGDRELSMAEAVTNAYCLMWDAPAPTWSMGMKNPLAP
jgi:hypothetical protein